MLAMEIPRPAQKVTPEGVVNDTLLAALATALVWAQMFGVRMFVVGGPGAGAFRFFRPLRGGLPFRMIVPGPLAFSLTAAAILPLALRRRFPLAVLAVTTLAAAAYDAVPHVPAFTLLGPVVAAYTVGTLYDRRTTLAATAVAALPLLAVSLPQFGEPWLPALARVVGPLGIAAAFGDATRNRRAYVAEVERRAEEAEARAEEEARRRAEEERLRIAREMHDITAHSMSVIAVQSGMASHVIDSDPAAARRALEDIRRTSRQALQELRSVLGVIRAEGDGEPPLAPTAGLARVGELARPLEEAGFEVDVDLAGDLNGLPQLVDASAFRIVQEALTNAMRHAEPSDVQVRVLAEEDVLTLEVANGGVKDGREPAEGHGISGMRERAAALGGTFSAGPEPGGRWRVSAALPLRRQT